MINKNLINAKNYSDKLKRRKEDWSASSETILYDLKLGNESSVMNDDILGTIVKLNDDVHKSLIDPPGTDYLGHQADPPGKMDPPEVDFSEERMQEDKKFKKAKSITVAKVEPVGQRGSDVSECQKGKIIGIGLKKMMKVKKSRNEVIGALNRTKKVFRKKKKQNLEDIPKEIAIETEMPKRSRTKIGKESRPAIQR